MVMIYASFHLIFFTFLISFCALAQNDGNVPVGSTLTANEESSPWLSPSGDFAFGFRQLQDKDLFLLSIWYYKIPERTVVWFINSTNPVPRGSFVELLAQAGLVLRDPQGFQLWSTSGTSGQADHGFMNDTGNFILKGSDDSWLWESFSLPADTILPMQELETGTVLSSKKSETNFSKGRFLLIFHEDGNLVLSARSMPNNTEDVAVYYNSSTSDSTSTSNFSYRLIFNSRGIISILRNNNQTIPLNSPSILPPASGNYFRATLDFDGVFTQYYHPRNSTGNQTWTVLWSVPSDLCRATASTGTVACGYNNICNLVNGRPICECPNGYSLLDREDQYGSCISNFTQSCGEVESESAGNLYDFVVLNNTDWPYSDYELIRPSTEAGCREACLQDCFCAVAIYRRYDSCWKKKLPLSNGMKGDYVDRIAFLKYRKSDAPPTYSIPEGSRPKDRKTMILVGFVILGSCWFLFIVAVCVGTHLFCRRKKVNFHRNNETNLHCFAYEELAEATNGFERELGRGSFGIVYKGELKMRSKNIGIAVKKLDRMARDTDKEFRAEVNTIGQTNHKNLVRLLGFCDEGQNRLLVYEYMSNGTLASFLFCTPKPNWNVRAQIAMGIARGLVYLHEECSTQIIHCDIKPQNILLDDYYNARISDFGLAKLLAIDQSRTVSNIRGTKGYVAPDWFTNTPVTAKVDVYSFGILLFEIIYCRRNVDVEIVEGSFQILTDWVWDCFHGGRLDTLVENDLEALNDKLMLERFVMVGICCIQEDSSIRPTMRKVSQMLEGIVEVNLPPCSS